MNVARLGSILVVGGGVVVGLSVAYGATGQAIGLGVQGVGGLLVGAALAQFGVGSALLGLAGPSRVRGRAVRASLAIVAAGMLSVLASAIASATSEFDSLESLPIVVLTLGGGLLVMVGVAALAITVPISLARHRRAEAPL